MTKVFLNFVVCIALTLPGTVSAAPDAERRVALVIGNSDYEHVASLPNPANDAEDISNALKRLGFEVTSGLDLDYRDMRLALRDFSEAAAEADVAVVYFAGHGIEIDNTNFLIPVNAELRSDRDVDFEAIRLDTVIGSLEDAKGLRIVLLDACRNNPFLVDMQRTTASRSIGRGLGRVDPGGVLVSYAARGGTIALDGEGRNSPYAKALLGTLETPGLEIGKLFRQVRDLVLEDTGGFQEPFTYGSLPGTDIFLKAPEPKKTAAASPVPLSVPPAPDDALITDFAKAERR
ncbi:MAG: caspase family protein, partial [Pseudomonadota bacterium]